MIPTAPVLLARSREIARSGLATAIRAALGTLQSDLAALQAASTSPGEARILGDAIAAVRAHREAMAAEFERGLVAAFDRKVQPKARPPAAAHPTLDELTLVDDAAMELELALGRLVRKTADELDVEELAAVGVRLGALAGGGPLEGSANPLGPDSALEALDRACTASGADGAVRMALVNSLQPHVALALRRLYPELNRMLIEAGVLPRVRHEIQRAPDLPRSGAGAGGAARSGAIALGAGAASGLPGVPPGMTLSQALALKDLLPGATGSPIDVGAIVAAMLAGPGATRRYGARVLANPAGSLFARAMATPVDPSVLAQLSQLQGAAVAIPGAGSGDLGAVVRHLARNQQQHPLDQLTGELVTVVFDLLLHDRALAEAVKVELGRLQIVALKAALLDRGFFARRDHPLRELLGAIAAAGADPAVDASPQGRFMTGLRAIIDEVVNGFTDDLGVFSAARDKLAAAAAASAAEEEGEVASLAAAVTGGERAAALRARAGVEVAQRLARAGAPAFLRRFLTDTWTHALVAGAGPGDPPSGEWDARLALVDDLLWSVTPKPQADVPKLTALLPKLVPALTRGMNAIDMPPDAQRTFLDELMQAHAALLQAARGRRAPPEVVSPSMPLPPEPLQAAGVELPAPAALAADALLGLARGAVVEFADAEPPVRAKLAWISPQRTVYLFTARGAKARQISPGELRARMRDGRARLVEEEPAVERAIAALVGDGTAAH